MDAYQTNHNDPFLLGLLLAVSLHVILIVGISFQQGPQNTSHAMPVINITLNPKQDTPEVEDAKYFAQDNQQGFSAEQPDNTPQEQQVIQQITSMQKEETNHNPKIITATVATRKIKTSVPDRIKPPEPKSISGAELISRSMELIRLDERIQRDLFAYANMPRQTYISTRTKKYAYANYMNEWVQKVERVGNANYPEQVRRQKLTGNLLLDVAIKPNGQILTVKVLRSSGNPIIDQAAIHIVHLSAPFAPFPKDIRQKTDILHISRTWEFINGDVVR